MRFMRVPAGAKKWKAAKEFRAEKTHSAASLTYYTLIICTLFLLALGLAMVFSVQSVTIAAQGGNAFTTFARYLAIALVGLVVMLVATRLKKKFYLKSTIVVGILAVLLQILVYFPATRTCAGGNCNWVKVPLIGTAQPSELIKLALVLYIGWAVVKYPDKLKTVKGTLLLLLPAALGIALVLGGGDLGTVVILVLLLAGALWMAGLSKGWFFTLGLVGLVGFSGATMLSSNRRARIMAWLNPSGSDPQDVGYQPLHARYALGTGGWTGVGPGSSRQKWGYLTQADSDYIFAVIGEELGLVGTLIVICVFAAIGWCCLRIMRNTNETYVRVVTGGIMCWIVGQALVNMCVVVGLLPVLGVPLPLISSGGSSLIFVLAAIGILLSFARQEPGAAQAFASRPRAARRSLSVITSRRRNRV